VTGPGKEPFVKKPSVVIVGTRGYPSFYGGFETAVRHLAPYLVESGWDVTVFGRPGSVELEHPDRDHRVRSPQTRGIQLESLSTLSYGFTSILSTRRARPDVALVMNVANGFWLPLLKSRGIPTLVNVDGIEWERGKWGRVAKSAFKLGAKLTARYADELVVDSLEIARRWRVDFDRQGTYIPYGGETHGSLPTDSGLGKGAYILAVARLVPENSIAEFLKAAELLAKEHMVVLVGKGTAALEMQASALAARETNFIWMGTLRDDARLHSLWQNAGAYFHGHTVGGTNPALVQALASGAPVVARDTPFNREVIGDEGIYVSGSVESIAEQLSALASNAGEQARMRQLASRRTTGAYTWVGVCAAYEIALRALAFRS